MNPIEKSFLVKGCKLIDSSSKMFLRHYVTYCSHSRERVVHGWDSKSINGYEPVTQTVSIYWTLLAQG